MLSTEHDTAEVDNSEKAKPTIVLDYNASKTGVDTMDQMVRTYTRKKNNNNNNLTCKAPVCAKKTSVALADRTSR